MSGTTRKLVPANPQLRERDQRLESLKAVVGKLAHDFNNFLVPLLGYVTLIKEEVSEGSSAIQYANTLENAARKTESYLDSILLAMRPHRHFNPREVNLGGLLNRLLDEWSSELPGTAQIALERRIEEVCIAGDEGHWRNAVNGLLTNARFALATGGRLEVELKRETVNEALAAELGISAGSVARLVVKDNGFGMNMETARRAFEPFFTTRTSVKASGLGLTIVHSVAQMQGGQVILDSNEEYGTTVTVYIPFTPPAFSTDRPESASPPAGKMGKGSRLLLVEDDPLVREVLKGVLSKSGLEIYVAQDGEEAAKLFRRYEHDWALVVTDVSMPKMNGVQLWQRVTATAPETRFIFLTGDAQFTTDELGTGFSDAPVLLRKPFTVKAFRELVRTVLGLV